MRSILSFLLTLAVSIYGYSQNTWIRALGKTPQDYAYAIERTKDGGHIITGATNSYGGTNYLYLIKTDVNGDTSWVKSYATGSSIYGYSVDQTNDRGYIIAGSAGLMRTDSIGTELWGFYYNSTTFYSARHTCDGGFIAVASIGSSSSSNGIDIILIKLNANGIKQWSRQINGPLDEVMTCVRQTPDSGYVLLGYTTSFGAGGNDLFLVKTNKTGDTLWTKTFGGTGTDGNASCRQNLEITSDSGYIMESYTSGSFGSNVDGYVIRCNAYGDTLWTRTYGGFSSDVIYNIKQTHDGGYIFTGTTTSFGGGGNDVYLVRLNAQGDTLWTKSFGGSNSDVGQGVSETSDGGFLVAGYTNSFGSGNNDLLLIKTDSLGNSSCKQFNTATVVNSTQTSVGHGAVSKIFITLNPFSLIPAVKQGGVLTDGCIVNEIEVSEEINALSIFPNPTNGNFSVFVNGMEKQKMKVDICSVIGEIVFSAALEDHSEIELGNLPGGIYFVRVIADKIYSRRIIVTK